MGVLVGVAVGARVGRGVGVSTGVGVDVRVGVLVGEGVWVCVGAAVVGVGDGAGGGVALVPAFLIVIISPAISASAASPPIAQTQPGARWRGRTAGCAPGSSFVCLRLGAARRAGVTFSPLSAPAISCADEKRSATGSSIACNTAVSVVGEIDLFRVQGC